MGDKPGTSKNKKRKRFKDKKRVTGVIETNSFLSENIQCASQLKNCVEENLYVDKKCGTFSSSMVNGSFDNLLNKKNNEIFYTAVESNVITEEYNKFASETTFKYRPTAKYDSEDIN